MSPRASSTPCEPVARKSERVSGGAGRAREEETSRDRLPAFGGLARNSPRDPFRRNEPPRARVRMDRALGLEVMPYLRRRTMFPRSSKSTFGSLMSRGGL